MRDQFQGMPVPPTPPGVGVGLPPPPSARPGRLLVALGTVMGIVALATSFLLVRGSDDHRAVPRPVHGTLALAFTPGQEIHYHLMTHARASIRRFHRNVPIRAWSSADLTWHVVSVDPRGTATVLVSRYYATVRSNTQHQQTLPPQQLTFHVSADGTVTGADGATLVSQQMVVPEMSGTDQLSGLLPQGDVEPGDRWTKHDSVIIDGDPLTFAAHCTYRRDVSIGTSSTAVITSNTVIPIDFFVPSYGHGRSANLNGEMKIRSATWVDLIAKNIFRTRSRTRFTFSVLVTGTDTGAPGTAFNLTGKVWTSLVRR